jgi:hypothetical protein
MNPGMNGIIRTEKAALTFSISILHLPTFSSLLLLSHHCKGPEKKFLPSLDQGRIATKREQQTRLTRTRDMALFTCEL